MDTIGGNATNVTIDDIAGRRLLASIANYHFSVELHAPPLLIPPARGHGVPSYVPLLLATLTIGLTVFTLRLNADQTVRHHSIRVGCVFHQLFTI